MLLLYQSLLQWQGSSTQQFFRISKIEVVNSGHDIDKSRGL